MQRYTYKPLHDECSEIRLLAFEPHSHLPWGPQPSPVRCRVKIVRLHDHEAPPYNAVSYCWGNNPARRPIYLDGKLHQVPESADIALRSLCRSPERRETLIWIDAICIDQANTQEKSHQVGLMGSIYTYAATVLIWLGDSDASIASALHSLHEVIDFCGPGSEADVQNKHSRDFPLPAECDWKGVLEFFTAPWFTRTWVLQECGLAARAICQRGAFAVPWQVVGHAARMMTLRQNAFTKALRGLHADANGLAGVLGASLLYSSDAKQHTPLAFIALNSNTQCKDPKDRVFALVGLMDPETLARHHVRVDYGQPLGKVYAAATRAVVLECNTLRPVMLAPNSKDASTDPTAECLPTWTPRYDRLSHKKPLLQTRGRTDLHASGDTHVSCHFVEEDLNVLRAAGVSLGRVSASGRAISSMPPESAEITDMKACLAVEKIGDGVMAPWETRIRRGRPCVVEDLIDLADILTCGRYGEEYDTESTSRLLADLAALLLYCIPHCTSALDPKVAELLMSYYSSTASAEKFWNCIDPYILGSYYFETYHGLMGVGTGGMEPDDLVCILFGCDRPLVLRERAHGWHIVGTAYVPGVMKGEYVHGLQDAGQLDVRTQWFDIR